MISDHAGERCINVDQSATVPLASADIYPATCLPTTLLLATPNYYWILHTTQPCYTLTSHYTTTEYWLLHHSPVSNNSNILQWHPTKKIPQLAPHQPSANMAYPPTPPTPSLKIPLASYPPFKHLDVELQMFVSTTTNPQLPTLSAPIPNLDHKQWKASHCTTTLCV